MNIFKPKLYKADRQCNIAGNLNHRDKLWHVTFDCNY